MEQMNDDELRKMLRQWQAPLAPEGLERSILRRARPRWRWLLTGAISVPAPVALCVAVLLVLLALRPARQQASDLSDFQQVNEFKPRIVRIAHDSD
jgi:hypothetical protein